MARRRDSPYLSFMLLGPKRLPRRLFSTTSFNMLPTPLDDTTPTDLSIRPRPPPSLPSRSHSSYLDIIDLFSTLLPAEPHHLPLLYHTPRRTYQLIKRLILSITPTPGIYSYLTPHTAVFLHRPWQLERRRMFPSNLVLTSHQRLDELLTTGYNLPLMDSLGLDVEQGRGELIGYKTDAERKMGVVARVPSRSTETTTSKDKPLSEWLKTIEDEFHGLKGTNFDHLQEPPTSIIPKYIACMNAFEPTIIDRLLSVLSNRPPDPNDPPSIWNDTPLNPYQTTEINPNDILYITGEPRPLGTEHAKTLGIPTVFIGHNRSEVWAIRWLAQRARERFGQGVEVIVVDEEEIVPPKPIKPEPQAEQDKAMQGKPKKRISPGDTEISSRQVKDKGQEEINVGVI